MKVQAKKKPTNQGVEPRWNKIAPSKKRSENFAAAGTHQPLDQRAEEQNNNNKKSKKEETAKIEAFAKNLWETFKACVVSRFSP